jgi:hypothetical protein
MTAVSLLPPNRTPWETALSLTSAERRPLPTHLVSSVWSPDTCPAHLLGYLANQLSLDVWDETWPETTKREACRKALELHRLKTTLAGIKAHVALAGSTVKRAIRPPASGFLYASMTDAQRKAWLDSLPQVRIYPFYNRSIAKSRHFGSAPGRRQFHSIRGGSSFPLTDENGDPLVDESGNELIAGGGIASTGDPADDAVVTGFLRYSRGRSLYGRRATLYDRGVETEVTYEASDGEAVERVYIGGLRKRQWHNAGHVGQGHLTATQAGENVVTVRLGDDYGFFAIGRSAEPVDVRPQRVYQPRTAPASRAFCGRHRKGTFLKGSFGPLLVYDRVSLHDPDRLGARRKTRSFHGYGRFGIADYTAELRIRVPMLRPVRRSGRWHGAGYRQAADMSALRKAIEAVRVSKAFRDTVMIDTATYGQAKFGRGLRFGEFTFGEIREAS